VGTCPEKKDVVEFELVEWKKQLQKEADRD